MKACSNCGAMLEDYMTFCTNCGVKAAEPLPQPEVRAEAAATVVPVPEAPAPKNEAVFEAKAPEDEAVFEAKAPVESAAQPPFSNPVPTPPPAGTPVYAPPAPPTFGGPRPPMGNAPMPPQLNYTQQRSNGGMMAWAIVLLVLSALTGSTITIAMQIIAIIALGDAKVALTQQIYEHKVKVAKILNIVSTVIVSLVLLLVITFGTLLGSLFSAIMERAYSEGSSYSDNYSYSDDYSYSEDDYYSDFYDDVFGY